MTEILAEIKKFNRCNGYTYSSYEVVGLLKRAEAEIERLTTDLRLAVMSDSDMCKALEADNAKLRIALHTATSVDVDLVVPDRDYQSMSPLDCYEAGMLDAAFQVREAIRKFVAGTAKD